MRRRAHAPKSNGARDTRDAGAHANAYICPREKRPLTLTPTAPPGPSPRRPRAACAPSPAPAATAAPLSPESSPPASILPNWSPALPACILPRRRPAHPAGILPRRLRGLPPADIPPQRPVPPTVRPPVRAPPQPHAPAPPMPGSQTAPQRRHTKKILRPQSQYRKGNLLQQQAGSQAKRQQTHPQQHSQNVLLQQHRYR